MTTSRPSLRKPAPVASESAAKKDVQKLQRAIVDGLEDVKAQDIVVFNTEALSSLFERVIIASGTSNRQTKALAASVRDAVREAGFPKPRIEGEDNGEWIIVDCGAAVAHIMQPTIRQYYHLEEIWGQTPVRLKFGATKPVVEEKAEAKAAPAKKSSNKKADSDSPYLRRSSAVKTAERDAKQAAEKAAKPVARKRPAGAKAAAGATAAKPTKVVVKAPAKKASPKVAAKSPAKGAAKPPAKAAAKKTAR